VAVILASVLTIIYIAFRFRKIGGLSAGVCAVTALFHDVIIVYGVFNLCGFEISANFMAVILTILGYSINNTIVVYDRIRENEDILDEKTSFAELINTSLNQSFTRSIHTSVSTFIAMFVVCVVAVIFKVDTILTFSLPLMVGIVVGTYSSLCFAPNLWGWWCSRKGIATIKDAKQARKK
jgi:preprotein translocase SecF subunit